MLESHQYPSYINDVCEYLKKHKSMKTLCIKKGIEKELHLNYETIRKKFRRYVGISLSQYHDSIVLDYAIELLSSNTHTIFGIAIDLGFCDDSHFIKWFKTKQGITPYSFKHKIVTPDCNTRL